MPAVGRQNSQPTTAECEVLSRLAIGGMAELYLARQHGAIVVLKRILPHLAEDPEFVRMFHDEANLAASLDHPNIVRVFDQGRDGDNFYFTMEYVHGENVRTMIRAAQKAERFLPLHHVIQIGVGVAQGLHYAHERRDDTTGLPLEIVHRDVSPTNVLVAFDGAVKIVDFGIAKAAAATHITQAGMLKGKASYMSPEQCRAEPVDRRSDVFAIGILLYEMTTLTRLFRGDNELAVLHQVLTGRVDPPSERVPGFPPGLEGILLKALQQSPADRYQTGAELGEALAEWGHVMGLPSSEAGLGQYLRDLCGDRPLPWKDDEPEEDQAAGPVAAASDNDDGETRVARSDRGSSQIAGGAPDLTPTPWPAGEAAGNGRPPAQRPVDEHAVEPTTVSTPPTASESGLAPVNESTPVATARPVFSPPTAPAVQRPSATPPAVPVSRATPSRVPTAPHPSTPSAGQRAESVAPPPPPQSRTVATPQPRDVPPPAPAPPARSGRTLPARTPSGRTLPARTPSGRTLPARTPSGRTASVRAPSTRTPSARTPSGRTPAARTPSGRTPAARTPSGRTASARPPAPPRAASGRVTTVTSIRTPTARPTAPPMRPPRPPMSKKTLLGASAPGKTAPTGPTAVRSTPIGARSEPKDSNALPPSGATLIPSAPTKRGVVPSASTVRPEATVVAPISALNETASSSTANTPPAVRAPGRPFPSHRPLQSAPAATAPSEDPSRVSGRRQAPQPTPPGKPASGPRRGATEFAVLPPSFDGGIDGETQVVGANAPGGTMVVDLATLSAATPSVDRIAVDGRGSVQVAVATSSPAPASTPDSQPAPPAPSASPATSSPTANSGQATPPPSPAAPPASSPAAASASRLRGGQTLIESTPPGEPENVRAPKLDRTQLMEVPTKDELLAFAAMAPDMDDAKTIAFDGRDREVVLEPHGPMGWKQTIAPTESEAPSQAKPATSDPSNAAASGADGSLERTQPTTPPANLLSGGTTRMRPEPMPVVSSVPETEPARRRTWLWLMLGGTAVGAAVTVALMLWPGGLNSNSGSATSAAGADDGDVPAAGDDTPAQDDIKTVTPGAAEGGETAAGTDPPSGDAVGQTSDSDPDSGTSGAPSGDTGIESGGTDAANGDATAAGARDSSTGGDGDDDGGGDDDSGGDNDGGGDDDGGKPATPDPRPKTPKQPKHPKNPKTPKPPKTPRNDPPPGLPGFNPGRPVPP